MVILTASFPGPRVTRRIGILREPSTTVLGAIAAVTVHLFPSLPTVTDFLSHDRWGYWVRATGPELFGLYFGNFRNFLGGRIDAGRFRLRGK